MTHDGRRFGLSFQYYVEITDWQRLRRHVADPVEGNPEPYDVVWGAINAVGPTRLSELEAAGGGEIAPGLNLVMPPRGKGTSHSSWDADGADGDPRGSHARISRHLAALDQLSDHLRVDMRTRYYSDPDDPAESLD